MDSAVVGEAMKKLHEADAAIKRLEPQLEAAREKRLEAIAEAIAGGATLSMVASMAGLSAQRVHELHRGYLERQQGGGTGKSPSRKRKPS